MIDSKPSGNDYLFEIATFLAASAQGCLDEPPLYGPFRLLDALSKLATLPDYAKGLESDSFLKEIKSIIDEKKFLVMYDVEGFKNAIAEINGKFAKELINRYVRTRGKKGSAIER